MVHDEAGDQNKSILAVLHWFWESDHGMLVLVVSWCHERESEYIIYNPSYYKITVPGTGIYRKDAQLESGKRYIKYYIMRIYRGRGSLSYIIK